MYLTPGTRHTLTVRLAELETRLRLIEEDIERFERKGAADVTMRALDGEYSEMMGRIKELKLILESPSIRYFQ